MVALESASPDGKRRQFPEAARSYKASCEKGFLSRALQEGCSRERGWRLQEHSGGCVVRGQRERNVWYRTVSSCSLRSLQSFT